MRSTHESLGGLLLQLAEDEQAAEAAAEDIYYRHRPTLAGPDGSGAKVRLHRAAGPKLQIARLGPAFRLRIPIGGLCLAIWANPV